MERDEGRRGRAAWSVLVFSIGFFALAAQTLLFRGYLASFEGSELGIGSFFGSWLGAVALGALAGRVVAPRAGSFALLALLYLPAYVLQSVLIANVRGLAGVAPYEAFPLGTMLAASLPANAPVGLVTGFLFPAACRSAPAEAGLPVARVYVLEALGGFAGGTAVTLLLRAGAAGETVFFASAVLLAGSAALFFRDLAPAMKGIVLGLPVVLAACLAFGLDREWAEAGRRAAWRRLLPGESYRGSFATAQGRYLYGEREGQFLVVSWGGVTETLPDAEHASEVLAVHLAQRPGARRVAVVGAGALAVCLRLAELPQVERIAWLHPDPDYPRALRDALPERLRRLASRVEVPDRDARRFLRESSRGFDLVLLDLPDVTTLVLNRYATREFYALAKEALAPGGMLSVRISGGENYLGGELAYLGCSVLANLEASFGAVALKPGEESWFLASDAEGLSTSPALLRDRFAGIPGAAALYPPEGLLSLYPPDRIGFQMERYRRRIAESGEGVLLNTERRPKALLYGLAAGLRRAGVPVARHLPVLMGSLLWIGTGGALLYALLRVLYLLRLRSGGGPAGPRPFDAGFLVFSAGAAGMGLSVVLLFLYQSRHGSLYLDVGMMSSLFMLGLFLGGLAGERLLTRGGRAPGLVMALGVAASLGVMLLVLAFPADAPRALFAALFALAGGAMGVFFPVAARRMQEAGRGAAASGAVLETADHLGGAAGAVGTALLMLPACGTEATLVLLGLLVGVNVFPALAPARGASPADEDGFDRAVRPAAYGTLGLAAFLLLASQVMSFASAGREGRLLEAAARELLAPADPQARAATLRDGRSFAYFAAPDGGYVFRTRPLSGGVSGYGGPIDLAVHVDAEGVLRGTRVLESSETPAYLRMTEAWRQGLSGRNLFAPDAFAGADAVTGATITSNAITRTLDRAGRAFAVEVLGRPEAAAPARAGAGFPDVSVLCLAALAAAALASRYYPRKWLRRLLLLASLGAAGAWLNLQYSTQQVFSLLGFGLPAPGFTAAFFMVAAVPALVALFGNVYCGSMCPFGALQELAGDLRGRLPTDPRPAVGRWGRAVKYALLALLAAAFALTRDAAVLAADPLTTFFSALRRGVQDGWAFGLGIAAVALAVFFRRFWCRNLCPAGAFLALLAGLRLLRKFLPEERPGRCDMGVRAKSDLDCLSCDRCRHEAD